MQEITERSRSTPILLIGTKSDLRNDKNIDQNCLVSKREAKLMAQDFGAIMYLECSSKSMVSFDYLFGSFEHLMI